MYITKHVTYYFNYINDIRLNANKNFFLRGKKK